MSELSKWAKDLRALLMNELTARLTVLGRRLLSTTGGGSEEAADRRTPVLGLEALGSWLVMSDWGLMGEAPIPGAGL